MDDTVTTAEEGSELKAAIRQMFEEMDRINERIERKQANIEQLKLERRAILADIRSKA